LFPAMVDGTNPQVALQGAEGGLDLRQLNVAGPQHRGIFAAEIGAQQIVSIALFEGAQLGLVQMKVKGLASDRLAGLRKVTLAHLPRNDIPSGTLVPT